TLGWRTQSRWDCRTLNRYLSNSRTRALLEMNSIEAARPYGVRVRLGHHAAVADHAGKDSRPISGAERVLVFQHMIRAAERRKGNGHIRARFADTRDCDAVERDAAQVSDA